MVCVIIVHRNRDLFRGPTENSDGARGRDATKIEKKAKMIWNIWKVNSTRNSRATYTTVQTLNLNEK